MRVFTSELRLAAPWRVAHGTSTVRTNVFVDLGDGLGEAAIVPYYPHTREEVCSWLANAVQRLEEFGTAPPFALPSGPPPARAALDMALHDRWARRQGLPLAEALALPGEALPTSSITISIPGDEVTFAESLERYDDWPTLKLKLGTGDAEQDLRWFEVARSRFTGIICIDANGAWDLQTAVRLIGRMSDAGVDFIEEPLHDRSPEAWRELRDHLPNAPPLIADESVQSVADIDLLAPWISGVNLKLAKTGGISEARTWIDRAQTHRLLVLIGCMVESSLSVTAAAHLAPLADFADLDGHLHVANDPYLGVSVSRGNIQLPTLPGLGVQLR